MSSSLPAAITIFILLLVDLAVLNYLNQRIRIHPEVLRKALHVTMGLVAMCLPWIFHEPTPVIWLGLACIVLLLLIKYIRALKRHLGSSLNLVNRNSLGEIYFTLGVVITFVLAEGNTTLYVLPILILTFADALAALSGTFSGIRRFTTPDGEKTIIGSVTFFISALFLSLIYMQIFADFDFTKVILISLILGMALMMVEAIAWKGMDNLLVPVGCYYLLEYFTAIPDAGLLIHFLLLLSLFVILLLWQRYSSVKNEVVLIAILYGYFSWEMGGYAWLSIGFAMLVLYPFLSPATIITRQRQHGAAAGFCVLGSGLLWILIEYYWYEPYAYYFYTMVFAMQLAIIQLLRLMQANRNWGWFKLYGFSSLQGYFIIFGLYLLFDPAPNPWLLLLALPLIILSLLLFHAWQGDLELYPVDNRRWLRQFVVVSGMSLLSWQLLSRMPWYV